MHVNSDGREWRPIPRPNFEPGEEVAGFVIERAFAAGGSGMVYRAWRGGRLFALKRVPWKGRGDRELDALRRVQHPNVVGFHGYSLWPHEEPLYLLLVLEFVRGRPLERWALEVNPCARDLVKQVLLPLSASLETIHEAGVVHRDVKEANIVMRESDGQPVLVDFGAAIYTGAPRLTDQMPPGTAEYRSPEVMHFALAWDGSHYPAGPADDLWALGVTLYGLLTRELPFGDRRGPLTKSILERTPPPPHERNPRVPQPLSELCLRMLEKDPQARYATAPALTVALEALLQQADDTWSEPLFPGPFGKALTASDPPPVPLAPDPPPSLPGISVMQWGPWAVVLMALLGVFFLLPAAPRQLPGPEPFESPRRTSSSPLPPREAGARQELAPGTRTGDVGSSAEPRTSPLPAPAKTAIAPQEEAMKSQKAVSKVKRLLVTGTACVSGACATGPQLHPPPPEECPAGASDTRKT